MTRSWEEFNSQAPSAKKTVASTNTRPPWEPVGLKPVHVQMVRMHVEGLNVKRIQNFLKGFGIKYSGRQIDRVITSQKGRELAELLEAQKRGELVEELGRYVPEAVLTEVEIMRNPFGQDRHRLNAAQDLMDRGGPPKISRQQNDNLPPQTIIVNLTPSQLSAFQAPPTPIEVEAVEIRELPGSRD